MSEASRRRLSDENNEEGFAIAVSNTLKERGLPVDRDQVSVKISGSVAEDNEVATVTVRVPTRAQADLVKDEVDSPPTSVFWRTMVEKARPVTISKSGDAEIIRVRFDPPALPAPAPPPSSNQSALSAGEDKQTTLEPEEIAGISVGALAGLCLCAAGVYMVRLKVQQKKANTAMLKEVARGDEATLLHGQSEIGEAVRPSDATSAPPLQARFVQR